MLPCEEVHKLAEEYVSETLEPARRAEVARHLLVCQSCHRVIEEARLARRVLQDAGSPQAPARLADRIKLAACTRLSRRPRTLQERALGSPAFLATCASLLCGFVICLLAIAKVAYVEPWPQAPPPDVSVVETYRLPARDIAPLSAVRREPAPAGPSHPHATLAPRRAVAATAARVAPRATSAPRHNNPARAAQRPARVLAATLHPAPAMSTAAHLPSANVTLAGARISRPDGVAEPIAVTPPGLSHPALFDTDDWREVAPADAPTPAPRADFTSARP